jgi:hypothetical protein
MKQPSASRAERVDARQRAVAPKVQAIAYAVTKENAMSTDTTTARDAYVNRLKAQLDRWNAQAARLETQAQGAAQDMKARCAKDLQRLQAEREKALYQLKLLEGASATAWHELRHGADEAWARMREAIAQAATNFEKR